MNAKKGTKEIIRDLFAFALHAPLLLHDKENCAAWIKPQFIMQSSLKVCERMASLIQFVEKSSSTLSMTMTLNIN